MTGARLRYGEEPVIDEALRRIREELRVEVAAVYLREPEQPLLRVAGFRNAAASDAPPAAREYAWGKGLVGGAAERAEPLSASDPDLYALAAPMLLGDEVVGTVAVGVGSERRFTAAEAELLLARARALARRLAPTPLEALHAELSRRVAGPALTWIDTLIAAARRGERDAVVDAFPAVSRRVGREPMGSGSALVLRDLDAEVPLRAWRLDDAARAALICAFAESYGPSDVGESSASPARGEARVEAEALARELYSGGDLRERAGALRGLAVVGRSAAALDAVLDACRVTAVELFEAAIAENPYSARILPDEEFRKVVLKCAFVGVSLDRVIGLETRADAELSRMLLSYVSEREVAGRSVPPDIWPVVALHPTPGLAAKLCGYLEHPSETHRAAAALALGRIADRRTRAFLDDRLARETDRVVRRALERALA